MKSNKNISADAAFFGSESIGKILLKIAPPVMFAQLIQALYNIVDSFFVGKYSDDSLTALTVIYPLQLIIIAVSVGTGVGVNTYMARKYALGKDDEAKKTAGAGMFLEIVSWAVFALISFFIMRPYVMTSATSVGAINDAVTYGNIVCIGSLGTFLEANWSKVHQSSGNMRLPMLAQVAGAVTNIILDPIMIFGLGPVPEMGVAGAAYATVCGQFVAAIITGIRGFHLPPKMREIGTYIKNIYFYGYSSIFMQAMYTVYIFALNVILAGFSDAAVTVLGLYYKTQSFFFIPLLGLQTCIVPVISFNYARKSYSRVREIMKQSLIISAGFMIFGIIAFLFFPYAMIHLFSNNDEVLRLGKIAFPIIGTSFIPAAFSLMMPVFFQAIGDGKTSVLLSILRQIVCLIPIFWAFSLIGVNYTWISFPASEIVSGAAGMLLYARYVKKWKKEEL